MPKAKMCHFFDIGFVNVGSRCAREFRNLHISWMKSQEHKSYPIDIQKYMSTRIAQGRDPQSPIFSEIVKLETS